MTGSCSPPVSSPLIFIFRRPKVQAFFLQGLLVLSVITAEGAGVIPANEQDQKYECLQST
jgi:hypothetical protein